MVETIHNNHIVNRCSSTVIHVYSSRDISCLKWTVLFEYLMGGAQVASNWLKHDTGGYCNGKNYNATCKIN